MKNVKKEVPKRVRIIMNVKKGMNTWNEENGESVYCDLIELQLLFKLWLKKHKWKLTKLLLCDFVETFNRLNDFVISIEDSGLVYYRIKGNK